MPSGVQGVEVIKQEVDMFTSGSTDPEVLEVKNPLEYMLFEPCTENQNPNGIRDHIRKSVRNDDVVDAYETQTKELAEAGSSTVQAQLTAMLLYIQVHE